MIVIKLITKDVYYEKLDFRIKYHLQVHSKKSKIDTNTFPRRIKEPTGQCHAG